METVSSLGNPASADNTKLYRLSTDNNIYYVNSSTLWVQLGFEGWPRRDGSDDDEFEGSNTDPPSGWTWDNQDTTLVDTNNNLKGSLHLYKSADDSGTVLPNLYKSVSGLSSKRFYTAVTPQYSGNALPYKENVCVCVRNSSNGKLMNFCFGGSGGSGGYPSFIVQRWTSSSSFSANQFFGSIYTQIGVATPLVMSIRGDGTTIYFEYAPYYNGSENVFTTVYSETIAGFLGSMDQISIGLRRSSVVTTTLNAYFHWTRVI